MSRTFKPELLDLVQELFNAKVKYGDMEKPTGLNLTAVHDYVYELVRLGRVEKRPGMGGTWFRDREAKQRIGEMIKAGASPSRFIITEDDTYPSHYGSRDDPF